MRRSVTYIPPENLQMNTMKNQQMLKNVKKRGSQYEIFPEKTVVAGPSIFVPNLR